MGPIAIGTDGAARSVFGGILRLLRPQAQPDGYRPIHCHLSALSRFRDRWTRTVQDAATVMNILKQEDARDWTALPPDPADYTQALEAGIRGMRIAYSPTLGYARAVDPEVAAAVQTAVRQLEQLGVVVEQVDPLASKTRWISPPACGSWARGPCGTA